MYNVIVYDHQNNAGDIHERGHGFRIIQNVDLDSACLESQNDSYDLQENEVDEDDDIQIKWSRTGFVTLPHTVFFKDI